MSEVADMILMDLEEKMEKAEVAMRNDLGAIRTGKASPALVLSRTRARQELNY